MSFLKCRVFGKWTLKGSRCFINYRSLNHFHSSFYSVQRFFFVVFIQFHIQAIINLPQFSFRTTIIVIIFVFKSCLVLDKSNTVFNCCDVAIWPVLHLFTVSYLCVMSGGHGWWCWWGMMMTMTIIINPSSSPFVLKTSTFLHAKLGLDVRPRLNYQPLVPRYKSQVDH